MSWTEKPLLFDCDGDRLLGVLSLPDDPVDIGIVIVVGGPQYRVGSHRLFVRLARALADQRVSCLRFDHRGMGDSEGETRDFEGVGPDIQAATSELLSQVPAVQRIVLWGLCDGASAAMMAAARADALAGIVCLNPWVRSKVTLDRAVVRHYYPRRVISIGFWRKLLKGQVKLSAAREMLARVRSLSQRRPTATEDNMRLPFQQRMLEGIRSSNVPILVALSGHDLTAREFTQFAQTDLSWQRALTNKERVTTVTLPDADHTFSSTTSTSELISVTLRFVARLAA